MKLIKIYSYFRKKSLLKYYTKFKEWLRQSTIGKIVDRAARFFIITAITTFFTNYAIGSEVIPVIQSSLIVAGIALYDKVKNEWLARMRDRDDETITRF